MEGGDRVARRVARLGIRRVECDRELARRLVDDPTQLLPEQVLELAVAAVVRRDVGPLLDRFAISG